VAEKYSVVTPRSRATAWTRLNTTLLAALSALPRNAIRDSLGTSSQSSSIHLPARSPKAADTPVMLPPGLPRLRTNAEPTGSAVDTTTIGIDEVACLATRLAGVP